MIIHTTCIECGRLLQPATLRQRRHPDCSPDDVDQLESAFLTAVAAGDLGQAAALALQLDATANARTGLLEAAMAYARHGWPVFPLRPLDKRPATEHGFHDANTDLDRIARWWQRHPDCNIGIPTGHMFDVIDIDYVGKPDALDWWLALKDKDDFEVDGLVSTPRGLHAYVQPSGHGNSSKLAGINGVDYRGIGGYVVVPPSTRDDGKYQWMVLPSPRIKLM